MKRFVILITQRPERFLGVLALAGLLLGAPTAALAANPAIANITVNASDRLVSVNAIMVDGFTEKILEAVKSGVPMTFTYTLELIQHVDLLPDRTVSRNVISQTIQYDSLKDVYTFTAKGKNVHRKVLTKKRDRYHQLMLTLDNVPLAPIHRLAPNALYFVRIKADLETDRFWFPFNYLLFFVPFNKFETTWAKSSPLVLTPDLASPMEARKGKTRPGKKAAAQGLSHVFRSFNQ
ncbi:MAG: DUF4390 domain-containing protein [Nitrospinaceae bacterium]